MLGGKEEKRERKEKEGNEKKKGRESRRYYCDTSG